MSDGGAGVGVESVKPSDFEELALIFNYCRYKFDSCMVNNQLRRSTIESLHVKQHVNN